MENYPGYVMIIAIAADAVELGNALTITKTLEGYAARKRTRFDTGLPRGDALSAARSGDGVRIAVSRDTWLWLEKATETGSAPAESAADD